MLDDERDPIDSIVWRGNRVDLDVAERERFAGLKMSHVVESTWMQIGPRRFKRLAGDVQRRAERAMKNTHRPTMVVVLVGYEDRFEAAQIVAKRRESPAS